LIDQIASSEQGEMAGAHVDLIAGQTVCGTRLRPIQNIRRGHYELGTEATAHARLIEAFDELARAI
jgi:hypothetical protein